MKNKTNKTNKTNIMATALRAAALITASAGLASAQATVSGGSGVDMESTGTIINGSINTFPNGTTITWASTPGLQGFFVPAGQLTGLTPTGEEVSYEDLIPLKSTSISVMSGAPGAAPTGTGTLIDDTGISTNGLSLLDTSTGSLVDIAVTDGTLTVGGAPVTGGGGSGTASVEFGLGVDPGQLGYIPSDTDNASTAPAIYNSGGVSFSKDLTVSFGGHSYALYRGSGITWGAAYDAAKDMGGYLATFTTSSEWNTFHGAWVSQSSLDTVQCWLGMARTQLTPGGTSATGQTWSYEWITGERSAKRLGAGAQRGRGQTVIRFHNFGFSNPSPNLSNEAYIHTTGLANVGQFGTSHGWNDIVFASLKSFIVEFEQ